MDFVVKEKLKFLEKFKILERFKFLEKFKISERLKLFVRLKDFLVFILYQFFSILVIVFVEKRCFNFIKKGLENEYGIVRRKKIFYRFQFDFSCRYLRISLDMFDFSLRRLRISIDLERFFDEMGIDRIVLDSMFRFYYRIQVYELQSMSFIAFVLNDRSFCSDVLQGGEMLEIDKKIVECNSK